MLWWAIFFLVLAAIAGAYGFGALALTAGKVLCVAFLGAFLLFLISGWRATQPLP